MKAGIGLLVAQSSMRIAFYGNNYNHSSPRNYVYVVLLGLIIIMLTQKDRYSIWFNLSFIVSIFVVSFIWFAINYDAVFKPISASEYSTMPFTSVPNFNGKINVKEVCRFFI